MHPATEKFRHELYGRIEKEARLFLTNKDLVLILAQRCTHLPIFIDKAFTIFAEWMLVNQPDGRRDD